MARRMGEPKSPTEQDCVRVLALAERLRSLCQAGQPATAEPDLVTLGRARFFCREMAGLDPDIDAQLTRIESLLPVLFSPLRPAGYAGGLDEMRRGDTTLTATTLTALTTVTTVLGRIRDRGESLARCTVPA